MCLFFRLNDNGDGLGFNAKSLGCILSKIPQCKALVCPDIKAADPNASCSDSWNAQRSRANLVA